MMARLYAVHRILVNPADGKSDAEDYPNNQNRNQQPEAEVCEGGEDFQSRAGHVLIMFDLPAHHLGQLAALLGCGNNLQKFLWENIALRQSFGNIFAPLE